jgi:cytochrome c2
MVFSFPTKKSLVLISIVCIVAGCKMYFKTTHDSFALVKRNDSFERGKNLVSNICSGCHFNRETGKLSGRHLNDLPKIAGVMYSANLTHSATDGVTEHYSDAALMYLLKTGISRSGRFTPYMMRPMMADEDINDIIVYLRSDDEQLQAVNATIGKTHINFIGKIGLRHLSSPQPYNRNVARPDENDPVVYGRYLVAVIGCFHCHSQKARTLNYLNPELTKGYMAGGMRLKDENDKRIFGPNLTPDKETGIGNFSEDDFRKAITEGITPSGRKLGPPMPQFKHLTEGQIHSLYVYLHQLTPVRHKVR